MPLDKNSVNSGHPADISAQTAGDIANSPQPPIDSRMPPLERQGLKETTRQALTQPAIEEHSTMQATEATHAQLQVGPTGEPTQAPSLQPTRKMNALLLQVKEAVAQQKLSSGGQEWLTTQIRRWGSQEQEHQLLEEKLERIESSPCYMETNFPTEIRKIDNLKRLRNYTSTYIENTQHALSDRTISQHLHEYGRAMDRHLGVIETERRDSISAISRMEASTKDLETRRCEYLQEAMKLTTAKIENIEASIHNEAQTLQTNLLRQHKRGQIDLNRMQGELQLLQTPWPEPQPGVGARPEPQSDLGTRPGVRPPPLARER